MGLIEALPPGSRLGPYRIEVSLGAGGMGEVYRARDTRLGRTVAIKVLSGTHRRGSSATLALQEARAVSALNHPNIVTLYDIGRDGESEFLVLEYLAGKTLKETIPSGGLPLAEIVHYGVQVARALDAAHRAGITHRDIKPANIMVMPDSHVKVLDFGLAKLQEDVNLGPDADTRTLADMACTTPGTIVGTVTGTRRGHRWPVGHLLAGLRPL
jgi:eukaryotic-like serine/threonine-protein kinase